MLFKALSLYWEQSKDEYAKPVLLLSILVAITLWKLSRKEFPMPPGPWGLPIVGNLHNLDSDLHSCFRKLSLKYGPIMKIKVGSRVIIVLSSPEAVKEMHKNQDVNFGDHHLPVVMTNSLYGATGLVVAPYGEHWRMMRKVCVKELLSHGSFKAVYGLRRKKVREMVKTIQSKVGHSVEVGEMGRIAMFNIFTNMMWGNTLHGDEMRLVTSEFIKVSKEFMKLTVEPNISDFFPVFARFDIQGKERRMRKLYMWFDNIFENIIGGRRRMKNQEDLTHQNQDEENTDFLQVVLELIDQEDQKMPLTETHLKALFVDLTLAGTDTTAATIEWAMAELLNQPEIMKKAKDELDQVVGLDNVVEETHLSKLPYLDAIIKEVLRLHPPGPLLIPRRSRESCILGGYSIPKDATIFVNAWAIQRDPKYWEQPLEFRPARFMESSVEWDYTGNDHRYLPFGSGRRICAAVSVVDKLVGWLMASLLHSFDWRVPEGMKLDFVEQFEGSLKKKIPLFAVPTARPSDSLVQL